MIFFTKFLKLQALQELRLREDLAICLRENRMSNTTRNLFLTVSFYCHFLGRLFGNHLHFRWISMKIMNSIVNTLVSPIVSSRSFPTSSIRVADLLVRNRLRVELLCPPLFVEWDHSYFRVTVQSFCRSAQSLTGASLTSMCRTIRRLEHLVEPYLVRIDPKRTIAKRNSVQIILWALFAKVMIDNDRTSEPVETIFLLSDAELMRLLCSQDVSFIVRKYIRFHIQELESLQIEATRRTMELIVCDLVNLALNEDVIQRNALPFNGEP
jgi:hypothetical protein